MGLLAWLRRSAAPLAPSATFARKTKPLHSAPSFTTETTVATAAHTVLSALDWHLTRSRA
jgi:hypothetical protein